MKKVCAVCKTEQEISRGYICSTCLADYKNMHDENAVLVQKEKILGILPEYKKRLEAFEHFVETGEVINFNKVDFDRLVRHTGRSLDEFVSTDIDKVIKKLLLKKEYENMQVDDYCEVSKNELSYILRRISQYYRNHLGIKNVLLKELIVEYNSSGKFLCWNVGDLKSKIIANQLVEYAVCEIGEHKC